MIFLTDYKLFNKFLLVFVTIIGFLLTNYYGYSVGLVLDYSELKSLSYKLGTQYMIVAAICGYIFYSLVQVSEANLINERREVGKQKDIVMHKNKEIRASIQYAVRLQTAIFPSVEQFQEQLEESFIFYQPKDIVSGDFYWFEKIDEDLFFAVADCTGHGVPGALLSVLGAQSLNKSVIDLGLREPQDILNKTRDLVTYAFSKSKSSIQDGMDMSFCRLNLKTRKLTYSGAQHQMFRVTNITGNESEKTIKNENHAILEYKGDRQPIGSFDYKKPFSQIEIQLEKGDQVYLSTDGFPDQFGGDQGTKFMIRRFKNLLLSMNSMTMGEQRKFLENSFVNWKENEEQTDDVCVMGIRV